MINKIIQGDCIEVMKTLEDNCVDSIVTDPPYELGFMGKSWDATGIAYNVDMWKECFRVLKFGGHLLSFGGSRTYHRMAVAIEDAGFEIRDMVEWLYGSGFPKSLNIGKAVDKLQGNERKVMQNPLAKQQTASKEGTIHGSRPANTHISKGISEWEGWGTALKPAHEPIVLARKPLSEKTVAENVLKWGVGGINIDESRIKYEPNDLEERTNRSGLNSIGKEFDSADGKEFSLGKATVIAPHTNGRFPANLILSYPEKEYIMKEDINKNQKEKVLKWIYENA